ncbi:MAG: hypothetical protein EXS31_18795 [Pedosphaera sp.]|nr:hypothetical protein [Pedosphaera sp.]
MKFYVETTVPSFYFDTRSPMEMRSRRFWTRQWWDAPKPGAILVTGFSVLSELELAPGSKRAQAQAPLPLN